MRLIRKATLAVSWLFVRCSRYVRRARKWISLSASTSSRHHCRFTISRRYLSQATCGYPAIGRGTTQTPGMLGARHSGSAAGTALLWTPGYWGWNDGVLRVL